MKELTSISHGHIRLAFVYSLCMGYVPKIIKAFTSLPEYKNISFSFYEDLSANIVQELKSKRYDIGLCSYLHDDPEIEFTRLAKQEIVFIISNEHPLSKRKKLDLKDIANEPVILYTERSGMKGYLDSIISESGVKLTNVVSHVESENAMIGLVSINYGIGMMINVPVPEQANVSLIPMNKNRQKREIYVATVKNRPLMPVAQKFYRFLTQYCGDSFFNN
ncbi:LysR substrate-binding domain-containing protein [Gilliamella sp. N-G2]|uniref:LysR substrate-binding domain-containing protein n=1 Tax=Gilliamella sp. N-G2 TaxID=1970471 RepID=UPI00352743DF